jgi:hypothetical protein
MGNKKFKAIVCGVKGRKREAGDIKLKRGWGREKEGSPGKGNRG